MYNPVVGSHVETGKIFARKVWTCGYCGNIYHGDRSRCPQCKSKKLSDNSN